ncbi:MAG: class I SAM-dependent methyltransferase [Acidobacteriaceae bacterium]|nr:class I SAM-dependent methyltransferase [Acidobacteriaceae bacterium]
MKLPFSDNQRPNSWSSKLRRKRLARFLELIPENAGGLRILDVGGSEEAWQNIWNRRLDSSFITLLNLEPKHVSGRLPMNAVVGDVTDLRRFEDREFDLCFSNSLIEHLGTWAHQQLAAAEMRRVANGYFVQTPYRYFPLEPHYQVPFWAQLPVGLRTALHRRFDLGWMQMQAEQATARKEVEQIRLLTVAEMQSLFPDADVRSERMGPFVKSLIAVRRIELA